MRRTSMEDAFTHIPPPMNGCDVEKIYCWFKDAEHYVRINFVVSLLEYCCEFEYRLMYNMTSVSTTYAYMYDKSPLIIAFIHSFMNVSQTLSV